MKRFLIFVVLVFPVMVAAGELREIFQNPPCDAKPRGYWVWPHGNFDYSTIRRELREFKAKGLGGVDIFDLGIQDRNDVIPPGPGFMSPEQVDAIAFALDEAKKLQLGIGLIVSSSWNAGATWTPPEQAMMNLVASADTVQGPVVYTKKLPFPKIPDSFSKSYGVFPLQVPRDENGLPVYYRKVAVLAFPINSKGILSSPDHVRLIDDPDGAIELPEGRWVILRTVCTNFGQMLWVPSDNSQGLTMDHFSKEATTAHFQTIIDRLEKRCGPLDDTALERLYLASYETNAGIIWTATLPEEFYKRNHYRIEPFLPVLFGTVVQDDETTERFLYDFRHTVSELFIENLYLTAREICHRHGLLICSESGGPGPPLHDVPTEDLKALGAVDVMRGEFWVDKKERLNPDGFEQLQIVKSIASAAHIYGHKIVEMESFTSHVNWQEGPATHKPLADRAFCEGMNRVVYHTMSHNLPEAGKPGWTFQAGTHMNTNLTWWDMSEQLHSYLTRCSGLLQQGQFVADAAFYYGHEIPNFAKTKHIRPTLGPGYDYDDLNTDVLLKAEVKDGRVRLPSGMSYAVLVLPDDQRMDLAVIRKVKQLLHDGATIIGPKPNRVYGLKSYQEQERELRSIADELWGKKATAKIERRIGAGRLITGKTVRAVLQAMGVGPDVEFLGAAIEGLDFIHRRTVKEDIYFIRNADSVAVSVEALFRVTARQPELWDAVSGQMHTCALYAQEQNGIRLPLHLGPHGSIFVVFTDPPQQRHVIRVRCNGEQRFPAKRRTAVTSLQACFKNNRIDFSAAPGRYHFDFSDGSAQALDIHAADSLLINGTWEVRFPRGWGATPLQTFDSLHSWTESEEEGTRVFSGIAAYRKTVTLSEEMIRDRRVMLELGDVREIARAYLNGRELGVSSFAPHEYDVTGILRVGDNFLVIEVANTWLNRLIADDQKPAGERLTHTNLTNGPTGNQPWRKALPRPSGLLGPVRIISRPQ